MAEEKTSPGNNNLVLIVHVAAEAVVIGGLGYYFHRKIEDLNAKYDELKDSEEKLLQMIQKEENYIRELNSKLEGSREPPPEKKIEVISLKDGNIKSPKPEKSKPKPEKKVVELDDEDDDDLIDEALDSVMNADK